MIQDVFDSQKKKKLEELDFKIQFLSNIINPSKDVNIKLKSYKNVKIRLQNLSFIDYNLKCQFDKLCPYDKDERIYLGEDVYEDLLEQMSFEFKFLKRYNHFYQMYDNTKSQRQKIIFPNSYHQIELVRQGFWKPHKSTPEFNDIPDAIKIYILENYIL